MPTKEKVKEYTSPLLFNEETSRIHTFIDLQAALAGSDNGSMPTRIHLIPRGVFQTMRYGELTLDDALFDQLIANFNGGVRKGVPVDTDHDGGAANAWITALEKDAQGLWASGIEWTPLGTDRITNKIYRFMSPEFSLGYTDPEYSIPYGCVLIAGTLTNRPLFKSLDAIAGSEEGLTGDNYMIVFKQQNHLINANEHMPKQLQAILAKEVATLTVEDKAVLKAHEAELSDEQKVTYADALKATEEVKKPEVKVEAKETVEVKASEMEALNAKAEQGVKAMEELNAIKAKDAVAGFVLGSEKGKLPVTASEPLTKLWLSMNDEQRTQLTAVMELIPDAKMFGEVGGEDAEDAGADGNKKFNSLVAEALKANDGMTLAEAQRKVDQENPGLYN